MLKSHSLFVCVNEAFDIILTLPVYCMLFVLRYVIGHRGYYFYQYEYFYPFNYITNYSMHAASHFIIYANDE